MVTSIMILTIIVGVARRPPHKLENYLMAPPYTTPQRKDPAYRSFSAWTNKFREKKIISG
jgi:hypothetical protein